MPASSFLLTRSHAALKLTLAGTPFSGEYIVLFRENVADVEAVTSRCAKQQLLLANGTSSDTAADRTQIGSSSLDTNITYSDTVYVGRNSMQC